MSKPLVRVIATVAAAATLLGLILAVCPCRPRAAVRDAHRCCPGSVTLRAAGEGCCAAMAQATPPATASAPVPMAPMTSVTAGAPAALLPATFSIGVRTTRTETPPFVLRI